MQTFTKTEIKWIIGELDRCAALAVNESGAVNTTGLEKYLLKLRADNLMSVSDKLARAVKSGDKRIRID